MNMGEIALGLFGGVLGNASPALKTAMKQTFDILVGEARKTDNPWDDVAVGFLGGLIGQPTPIVAPVSGQGTSAEDEASPQPQA